MLISKEITRTIRGETKVVKVEDLPKSCKDKVLVKCDYCGKTYEQSYYGCLQSLKAHNGKNCCDYCRRKNPEALSEILRKREETNLRKFGVKNLMQDEEYKKELKEKRGYLSPFELKENQEKARKTCKEKYGYEYMTQHPDFHKNLENILLDKTGYRFAMQNPETKKKSEETCLERYGYRNVFCDPEMRIKIENEREERTGYRNSMQVPEVKQKLSDAYFAKTGYKWPSLNPEVKQKMWDNYFEKTGYKHPLQNPDVKQKIREEYFDKTGYYWPGENPEAHLKAWNAMAENGTLPISAQEKEVYNILSKKYNTISSTSLSKCVLDIVIDVNGILINIETDGYHWHCENKENKLYDIRRDKFTLSNGYDKVLRIVYNHSIPSEEEIFKAVEELINSEKTFKRIWSSDITEEQIEHFNNL